MEVNIYDEDDFLSIVNTEHYSTFVDENWTMEQLLTHFVNEINNLNCIVWQKDRQGGDDWTLKIREQSSTEQSFRKFSREIEVTNGKLYFVNYTDLTIAAQFEEDILQRKDNADQYIKLENGLYRVTVRQMFEPDSPERYDTKKLVFEISLK